MKSVTFTPRFFLNLFFVIVLLVLLITSIYSYRQLNRVSNLNQWVQHTHENMKVFNNILMDVLELETITRGYVITNNNAFVSNFDEKATSVFENFNLAKKMSEDNIQQQNLLKKLESKLTDRMDALKKVKNLKDKKILLSETAFDLVYQGQILTTQIKENIQELYENEMLLLREREEKFLFVFNKVNTFFIGIIFVNILLLLVIILFFNKILSNLIKAEQEAYKTASVLNGIIGGSKEFIAALDLNYNFLIFNPAFEKEFRTIFGKHISIGTNLKEVLAHLPVEQKKAMDIWGRALTGEEFTVIETFGADENVSNEYEITYSSIYNDKDQLIGASVIARDIGKRLEAEKKLKKFNEKLEGSLRLVESQAKEMTIINDLNNKLRSSFSLEESLNIIALYLKKLLPFTSGIIYLMNQSKNYLESAAEWGYPNGSERIFSPEQCLGLRQGNIYFYVNEEESIPCLHNDGEKPLKPYFCVPLLALNEVIGVLFIEIMQSHEMTQEELVKLFDHYNIIIQSIAGQVSLSISNIKLHDVLKTRSTRDTLTNLFNRSYLAETFARDIQRAKRKNASIAVVMMDLDFFKNVNDTYGHEAGDIVLQEVTKLLFMRLRKSDIACRYGGEEILIIMYDTDLNDAIEKIELLREEIAKKTYPFDPTLNITASFGIAMFPEAGGTSEELIEAADKALYQSKNEGRNKVTVFTS